MPGKALDKNIDGDYESDLWPKVKAGNFFRKVDHTYFVRLKVVKPTRIKAKLMRGNEVVSSSTLKGRVTDDGRFVAGPKTGLVPIPFLLLYRRLQTDLILTENNNLYVSSCRKGFGFFILFVKWNECSDTEFLRKK